MIQTSAGSMPPNTSLRPMPPALSAVQITGLLIAFLGVDAAFAHDAAELSLNAVTVQSSRAELQGIASSASEGVVTSRQLQARPLLRAGDLMETVPGLVATQHAGEGKANQYYLRGINLDHGTDLATFVDGIPVNLPSHGHGQGYSDLGFVIPELVESLRYRKGPYAAEDGDFATAGSVRLSTASKVDHPLASAEAGGLGYRRVLVALSPKLDSGNVLLAGERVQDNGPWNVKQDFRRINLVTKYTQGGPDNGWDLGLSHHEASWTSTDQIPQRAVDNGLIGRFGTLDSTAGGQTRRTGVNARWTHSDNDTQTQVRAYALHYTFELFSNFTYFTRGCDSPDLPTPCNGMTPLDQFSQVDRRNALGLTASYRRPLSIGAMEGQWTLGADLRRDIIGEIGLYDTQSRGRLSTVRNDRVRLDALGLWSQADLPLAPGLRAVLGWRWDRRELRVDSSVTDNSGGTAAGLGSPKASVIFSPDPMLDLYANLGRGFHSNDARGSVIRVDPRDPARPVDAATALVRATGSELGVRRQWAREFSTTVALWLLRMDSELLFVGDAGTTEPSRPSVRKGLEISANWRPGAAWTLDADLSLSRSRFTDAQAYGDRIPGAMERVLGVGASHYSGPWTIGARMRHFGSRALLEDNSLRGSPSTMTNLKSAYRVNSGTELSLDVFNLFNRKLNDTEYAYASRLAGEPAFGSATPATLHIHPAPPRTARIGLKLLF